MFKKIVKGKVMKAFKKVLTVAFAFLIMCLPIVSLSGCGETSSYITLSTNQIEITEGTDKATALGSVKITYSYIGEDGNRKNEEVAYFDKDWYVAGFYSGIINSAHQSEVRSMTITYRGCSATLRYTVKKA